jgi:hypothetical protein
MKARRQIKTLRSPPVPLTEVLKEREENPAVDGKKGRFFSPPAAG